MRIKASKASMSARPRDGPLAGVDNAPLRRRIMRAQHQMLGDMPCAASLNATGANSWAQDWMDAVTPAPRGAPLRRQIGSPVGALLPSISCHTSGDAAQRPPGVLDHGLYPHSASDAPRRDPDAGHASSVGFVGSAGFPPRPQSPVVPADPRQASVHPVAARCAQAQAITTLQGRQMDHAHEGSAPGGAEALRTIEWAMRQESLTAIQVTSVSVMWDRVNSNTGGLLDDALAAV